MDEGRTGTVPGTVDSLRIEELVNGALAEVVEPILYGVLRGASADSLAELRAETVIRLLGRLRNPDESDAIANFRDYAAVVTYHVFGDYMRRLYPQRARLKNRVRYVLEHDETFALDRTRDGAFVSLRGPAPPAASPPAGELAHAIGEVLAERGGTRMELDALVGMLADRLGIRDTAEVSLETRPEPRAESAVHTRLEARDSLRHLWAEVGELPPRQRFSLLMNLRDDDGDAALRLLPLTGIASIEEIARVLGLEAGELRAMWDGLPMPDAEIASRLGVTRQQVINLRKSARERLARRMAQHG
jgi:RNA polymerase sigma factor (sigma-70 family)